MHLLTAYLGNSEKIQIDHYLQVNDTDYENSSKYEPCTNISGAKSGAWSEQKAVQQQNATVCKELQELQQTPTNKAFSDNSLQLETYPILDPMRPIGVEPITYGSEDRCSIQLSYGRLNIYYRAKVIIFKLNFPFPAK